MPAWRHRCRKQLHFKWEVWKFTDPYSAALIADACGTVRSSLAARGWGARVGRGVIVRKTLNVFTRFPISHLWLNMSPPPVRSWTGSETLHRTHGKHPRWSVTQERLRFSETRPGRRRHLLTLCARCSPMKHTQWPGIAGNHDDLAAKASSSPTLSLRPVLFYFSLPAAFPKPCGGGTTSATSITSKSPCNQISFSVSPPGIKVQTKSHFTSSPITLHSVCSLTDSWLWFR